jgi:hypothetical protein
MKRLTSTALSLATAGFIAGLAIAGPGSSSPSQLCKAERAAANFAATHGGKTFAQFYATNKKTSNAFGRCVALKAKAKATTSTTTQTATQTQSSTSASSTCAAERADANFAATHGGKTFAQFYGTNANDNNAFGQCVSSKAKTA